MSILPIFGEDSDHCAALSRQYGFVLADKAPSDGYYLLLKADVLSLVLADGKKSKPLCVDFADGKTLHRLQYGGGKGQAIARAVSCKGKQLPTVLDATAGLGGDAFVLASLGCEMTLLEQSPVAAALLADGLLRAADNALVADVVGRMALIHTNAIDYLKNKTDNFPDVIYLDPMFPERKKSAAVKKGMRFFHDVVGLSSAQEELALLQTAQKKALKRVVVKRPKLAGYLARQKPSVQIVGKTTRYDLYIG